MSKPRRSEETGPRPLSPAEGFRSGMVAKLALVDTTSALERQLGIGVVDEERATELAAAAPPQPEATVYQFPLRGPTRAEVDSGAPVANMMTPLPGFAEVAQMPQIEAPTYQDQQAA